MAMPGDNLQIKIKLSYPLPINEGILIYKGLRFAVREGGKTVGAGVISKVLPNEEADKAMGFAKKTKPKEWLIFKYIIFYYR